MNKNLELYNADALDILRTIESESVDLFVTDPPYKVTSRGSDGTMSGYWTKGISKEGNIFDNNDIDITQWIGDVERVLKDGSHFYIMCNHINLYHYLDTIEKTPNLKFTKCLIWDKQRKISGLYYMGQYEYILFGHKGKGVPINECGSSDIISMPIKKIKNEDGTNMHDTEKPVQLMEYLIKNSSKEGEIVLDSFMGIGATGVASTRLNRKFIGIEINPKYFSIAQDRIGNRPTENANIKQNTLF